MFDDIPKTGDGRKYRALLFKIGRVGLFVDVSLYMLGVIQIRFEDFLRVNHLKLEDLTQGSHPA